MKAELCTTLKRSLRLLVAIHKVHSIDILASEVRNQAPHKEARLEAFQNLIADWLSRVSFIPS